MAAPTPIPPAGPRSVRRQDILATAVELGEQRGWDAVHLHDIARTMALSLAEIRHHFADKDALAEAWFDLADEALVAACNAPGWESLSARQRLHAGLFAWLEALAPHRQLTRQMLGYKLHPEHLHLQAHGAVRISRTVQWWREAAWLPDAGWRRELSEAGLTAIFLSTFGFWLRDASPGARRTGAWLARQLHAAEWVATRLAPRA